jgi:hypothetical protein
MKTGAKTGQRMFGPMLGMIALAAGMALMAPGSRADDAAEAAGTGARAVRLSSVDGQVQVLQNGQPIADAAIANMPLFEGMQVVTSSDGRAEVQFEDGSVARLSPNSALTLGVLRQEGNSTDTQIMLNSGLGYFELQADKEGSHMQLRFGDSVVTVGGYSVVRVNLDNPPGEVAVFSGNAHLERSNALAVDMHGGESLALNGAEPEHTNLAESIEPDSWDTWNSDRDQSLTADSAARTGATSSYVNNNNPAWNDLDANGTWYNTDQGNIWSPYDAANPGWEPFGLGYWMWTPRFGYVWVSGNSWGYMPFQCGAWNYYNDFGWGWAPGMGGCNPWWFGGGYYGPNIGFGPGGYRPPLRPRPRQPVRNPIGGNGKFGLYPVIAVNRKNTGTTGGPSLPARDRNAPVTIAGHVAQPFHPLSPRPAYDHSASAYVNRTAPYGGGPRAGGGPGNPGGPGVGGAHPVYTPPARTSNGGHPAAPSHPAPASHAAPPPASHAASGGGGGGGAHAGGGGGGGGSHH